MAYPREQGKPMTGTLPDWAGPLNVNADKGDANVPQNAMNEVAPGLNKGNSPPDPSGFLTGIDRGGK